MDKGRIGGNIFYNQSQGSKKRVVQQPYAESIPKYSGGCLNVSSVLRDAITLKATYTS